MKISVQSSWRYGVIGFYADRNDPIYHIYPLPFIRVTLEKTND